MPGQIKLLHWVYKEEIINTISSKCIYFLPKFSYNIKDLILPVNVAVLLLDNVVRREVINNRTIAAFKSLNRFLLT